MSKEDLTKLRASSADMVLSSTIVPIALVDWLKWEQNKHAKTG